ncbi:orotidine-5'-phosphate decarboxylase [Candidatus Margulisiibacteriota bacterium]
MNFLEKLKKASKKNKSSLCIGLDPDISKIPEHYLDGDDPLFNFSKQIVDQTKDLVCAYKPNLAFYSMHAIYGIKSLTKIMGYIHAETDIPVILDAKCGDTGHTATAYAKAIFEFYNADATTINPYMGFDTVKPFLQLQYKDKFVFILCLTSNQSAQDFEKDIYQKVARAVVNWNDDKVLGLVVGATNQEALIKIAQIVPEDLPRLIPGIGAQGGDVKSAVKYGGKLPVINASRSIIYAENPRKAAEELRKQISKVG